MAGSAVAAGQDDEEAARRSVVDMCMAMHVGVRQLAQEFYRCAEHWTAESVLQAAGTCISTCAAYIAPHKQPTSPSGTGVKHLTSFIANRPRHTLHQQRRDQKRHTYTTPTSYLELIQVNGIAEQWLEATSMSARPDSRLALPAPPESSTLSHSGVFASSSTTSICATTPISSQACKQRYHVVMHMLQKCSTAATHCHPPCCHCCWTSVHVRPTRSSWGRSASSSHSRGAGQAQLSPLQACWFGPDKPPSTLQPAALQS